MSKSMETNTAPSTCKRAPRTKVSSSLNTARPAATCCRFSRMRILLVLLLLGTTSVSCGGKAGGEARRYDEEIRNNFLVECEVEDDASSCAKVLNCIEEDMTQDEFIYEENLTDLTGDFSDRLADVVARCMAEERTS